jgi:hypothetical protein
MVTITFPDREVEKKAQTAITAHRDLTAPIRESF